MCVIRPLKVTLTNYPADKQEQLTLPCHPKDESMGERQVVLSKTLWIDQADFMEDAPKKFFRLTVGKEVRLRGAYIVRCDEAIKDESGEVVELRCSYDPDTLGKMPTDRKVKGVIHWVSADKNQPVEVRLYDRLFTRPDPEGVDEAGEPIAFLDVLNPDSLQVQHGFGEQSLSQAIVGSRFQFEREGYFCIDTDSSPTKLVVNQTVSLKDSWAKQDKKSS